MDVNHRFKDASWYREEKLSALVVGAGGVGSWLSFFLARANFSPVIFDFDKVELHNLGGQLFLFQDLGTSKTHAINNLISQTVGKPHVLVITEAYKEDTEFITPFTFSCPDSISARKIVFEKWKENLSNPYNHKPILIDGRLEAEQFFIYCVTEETMDKYEEVLNTPIEITGVSCSYQQTSDVAAMCASFMVNFFKNHISNIYEKSLIKTVPFKYEMLMPVMFSNIIVLQDEQEEVKEVDSPFKY